jgi:hypothetical protein
MQTSVPSLKSDPKYGHFPWWPEDGDDWIHPEDVALARALIPSDRVFRRDGMRGPFVVLNYGDVLLRVRRTLWQIVPPPAFEIGDWVEVIPRGQQNAPRTGRIREILWEEHAQELRYQIDEAGQPIEHRYAADDLQPVAPTPHE